MTQKNQASQVDTLIQVVDEKSNLFQHDPSEFKPFMRLDYPLSLYEYIKVRFTMHYSCELR